MESKKVRKKSTQKSNIMAIWGTGKGEISIDTDCWEDDDVFVKKENKPKLKLK